MAEGEAGGAGVEAETTGECLRKPPPSPALGKNASTEIALFSTGQDFDQQLSLLPIHYE